MPSPRLLPLLDAHDCRFLPFRDLPRESQDCLLHFMGEQRDLWDVASWTNSSERTADIAHYGHVPMGIVDIPVQALIEQIVLDEEFVGSGFRSFAEYHEWYRIQSGASRSVTATAWPLILSDWEWETLQDGWDRLHAAVSLGQDRITCLFFPDAL